jgi:hypothetical protein
METNYTPCRRLIAAILHQAFTDAMSPYRADEPEGAKRFINANNELFSHYCHLIDLDPEYTAHKMQSEIKKTIQEKKDKQDRMRNVMYQL